jgi:hypothetical protein
MLSNPGGGVTRGEDNPPPKPGGEPVGSMLGLGSPASHTKGRPPCCSSSGILSPLADMSAGGRKGAADEVVVVGIPPEPAPLLLE